MNALAYTPVPQPCQGKRTIKTLTRLLGEVLAWAEENNQHSLTCAMRDAIGLTVTGWTEFDEGLSQLSNALYCLEHGEEIAATESIHHAMRFMRRWQDRDEAVGNVEFLSQEDIAALNLKDGEKIPESFASAWIEPRDEVERAVKGLRIVKSIFGAEAEIIINPSVLDTDALREVWPLLLDRLIAPPPRVIPGRRLKPAIAVKGGAS